MRTLKECIMGAMGVDFATPMNVPGMGDVDINNGSDGIPMSSPKIYKKKKRRKIK